MNQEKKPPSLYTFLHKVVMPICTLIGLVCILYFVVLILFMILRWLNVEFITNIYDSYASGMLYIVPIIFVDYLVIKQIEKYNPYW